MPTPPTATRDPAIGSTVVRHRRTRRTRRTRRVWSGVCREEGYSVLEAAIVLPVIIVLTMLVIQYALV